MVSVTHNDVGGGTPRPRAARGPQLWQARPRWLKSQRAREEDAERKAYLNRLKDLVGDDQYQDLVSGRVIMNPYLLEDLDRLAEWQRQQAGDDPSDQSPESEESNCEGTE
jgi:hypothetical protein